jgi:hypothetical protein
MGYALNRQGFLGEGLVSDFMASAGDSLFISSCGINLPDPPGVPVGGGSDQDILGELPE